MLSLSVKYLINARSSNCACSLGSNMCLTVIPFLTYLNVGEGRCGSAFLQCTVICSEGKGRGLSSGFRFLEHLFRCTVIKCFHSQAEDFHFPLKIATKGTFPSHSSISDSSTDPRQEECTALEHWCNFFFLIIKIRDLLDICPWAGQMCLLTSRWLRFAERLGRLLFLSEHYDFLTCAVPRVISLPLLIY